MSGATFKGQTAWEETEEEIILRLEQAKLQKSHWTETVFGLVLGVAALAALFLAT